MATNFPHLEEQESLKAIGLAVEAKRQDDQLKRYRPFPIYDRINETVIGQKALASQVAQVVFNRSLGLREEKRPKVSVLLSGRPGEGKTMFAKTLAKAVFPDKSPPHVLLDCGNVSNAQDFDELIFGGRDRYVGGADKKGKLIPFIERNPDGGVIIFDEIDKALDAGGVEVANKLYALLEEGMLTGGDKGEFVAKPYIIIMTSNYLQDRLTEVADKYLQDFTPQRDEYTQTFLPSSVMWEMGEECRKVLVEEGGKFPDALLDRFDLITATKRLDQGEVAQLARVFLDDWVNSSSSTITSLNGTMYVDEQIKGIMPFIASMLESGNPRRTQKKLYYILDSQLCAIVAKKIADGEPRQFEAVLRWDEALQIPRLEEVR